ncbi:hypothetical protein AB5N19_14254 [Seiridium cardinale]|uniref:Uncharacterized protein n=1 Tax=Seiridium cardinale TaxID=138064 RepID=A0ABR2XGJ4_9PEZI
MDSDTESDFYGDDTIVAELEKKVENFDVKEWWKNYNEIQTPLKIQSSVLAQPDTAHLYNPYAGLRCAWQHTESVDEFLDRLPPATTDETKIGPWIFICNPYIDRKNKQDSQNQYVKGCEDEAPEEEETDLMQFCRGGMERLSLVTSFHDHMNQATMTPTIRNREKNKAASEASRDILSLAHALHVRSGKWMLFCPIHTVNEVWGIVAKATSLNELGIAAKVATRSGTDPRTEQLICVYTADFADKHDVARVAMKLKQLGLVPPRGRPLYYKPGQSHSRRHGYGINTVPDAYTYLGISSGNAWGVKASIYNTADMIEKTR